MLLMELDKNNVNFDNFKNVFSKYFLKLKNPHATIEYNILFERII